MPSKRLIHLFFVFFSISPSFGGEWPQSKGVFYAKLSEWWTVSDHHFDGDGHVQPNFVEYGYYATSLYAEYGLSRKLTGMICLPFINYTYSVIPSSLNKQSILKIGDGDIGVRYTLTPQKPMVISASLILGLPLGYHNQGPLMTGDGEFNQIVRMSAGKRFNLFKSNAWFNMYCGYNHRTHQFADELQYGAEVGANISKKNVTLILRLDGIDALGSIIKTPVNPQSLFSNFKEYVTLSPEIAFHINQALGITIGAGAFLSGKNIFANPTFTIGVFHKGIP